MANLDDILEQVIAPDHGHFSSELAQHVLGLKFTDQQVARYETLAYRNQDGALTAEERGELEAFVMANTLLTVLKAKARRSMLQHSPAA